MTDEERLRRDRERKAAIRATPIGKLAAYRRVALHRARHSRTEATRVYWVARLFEIDRELEQLWEEQGPDPVPEFEPRSRSVRLDIEARTAEIRSEWDRGYRTEAPGLGPSGPGPAIPAGEPAGWEELVSTADLVEMVRALEADLATVKGVLYRLSKETAEVRVMLMELHEWRDREFSGDGR